MFVFVDVKYIFYPGILDLTLVKKSKSAHLFSHFSKIFQFSHSNASSNFSNFYNWCPFLLSQILSLHTTYVETKTIAFFQSGF